jgi:predicted acyltransferase
MASYIGQSNYRVKGSPDRLNPSQEQERLLSLDAFRGGTIAAMILVNNPGNGEAVYTPFEHAEWHGWTFTDLVFPFFLWIVGVAITFSFAKRIDRGDDRGKLFLHILRRSVSIFALGYFLNLFPTFDFANGRIPGVLQRIAICYLIAGTIFLFTKVRGRIVWIVGLLSVYWLLMKMVPVPGYGAGVLGVEGNLEQYIDGMFLKGHMYRLTRTQDPEGIVSTLPAIATALFGTLAGQLLQAKRSMEEKTSWLFFSGNCLIFAGLMLSTWMPINKKIWTSSFSVFMAGMASVVFACCYWLVDVKQRKRYSKPFIIYGMNAITIYALAGMVARLLGFIKVGGISLHEYLYENLFAPLSAPQNASLMYAIANVLFFYLIAYGMYRKKWFVRL